MMDFRRQTVQLLASGRCDEDDAADVDALRAKARVRLDFQRHSFAKHDIAPANARRAPEGRNVAEMLQAGEIDAGIMGNDLPKDDPRLITVIEDPKGDARRGYAQNRVIPINHMVVASQDLIERRPEAVRQFFDMLVASKAAGHGSTEDGIDINPIGVDALRHSLETVIEHCLEQKLIDRRLSVDELFHDKTRELGR